MAKSKYSGVTQNEDGSWTYRIKVKLPSGKVVDTRIKKDKNNNPFLRARDAYEAKRQHEEKLKAEGETIDQKKERYTLADIYENYLATKGKEKAPATLLKQDSMWRNHVSIKFGERDIEEITVVELEAFLFELYKSYSYKYVEGFIKFLYLLFGHADRMNAISTEKYNKMFVEKNHRLTMPAMTQVDSKEAEEPPERYDNLQIRTMERIFDSKNGNLKLAFYLGLYAGLRISECFGLRWRDINWEKQTISINRQLHYLDGECRLSEVKTLKSVREIPIPDVLYEELLFQEGLQEKNRKRYGMSYKDTERVYDEIEKKWITGGDFVNRKENGELLTTNSMKYWSKKIKEEAGIDFKYHNLRHTFASRCAEKNINLYLLMDIMGHKKIDTTKKYYIKIDNKDLIKETRSIINSMYEVDNKGWNRKD